MAQPELHSRFEWTNRLPGSGYGEINDKPDELDGLPNFQINEVVGIAIHWPGVGNVPATLAGELDLMRRVQNNNMDVKGYSDIMYSMFVPHSVPHIYPLRGLINKGAANGSASTNARFVSVLVDSPINGTPSQQMIEGVRATRQMVLARYPNASQVVPHSAIRPGGTACPGPAWQKLIADGALSVPPTPDPVPPPTQPWECPWPVVTSSPGSVGNHVIHLQNMLAWFHFYDKQVDGRYGDFTTWGVAVLQNALVADGFPIGKPTDGVYDAQTRVAACWWTRWLMDTGQHR